MDPKLLPNSGIQFYSLNGKIHLLFGRNGGAQKFVQTLLFAQVEQKQVQMSLLLLDLQQHIVRVLNETSQEVDKICNRIAEFMQGRVYFNVYLADWRKGF
jgi:hypothetical protein